MCDNVYQGRVVAGNIDVHCDPLSFITTLEGHFEIATLPNGIGAEDISRAVERRLHGVYEIRHSRDSGHQYNLKQLFLDKLYHKRNLCETAAR